MGVSICWEPLSKKRRTFGFGLRSKAIAIIERNWNGHITETAVPQLRAMAQASDEKAWDDIADAVEKYGEIRVWGEW